MTSYRIHLRQTDEGIATRIAEEHGDPEQLTVDATSIEHVGDQADPAINARLPGPENVTIWLVDIDKIAPIRDDE